MTIAAFTPSVWAARFERILDQNVVYGTRTNTNFEGEVSSYGDAVKIPFVGTTDVTVSAYNEDGTLDASNNRTATPQEMNGGTLDLTVDQQKQWAILVEDVEELQTRPNLMDAAMSRAGIAAAKDIDNYLKTVYQATASDVAADAARGVEASNLVSRQVQIPVATTIEDTNGGFGKAAIAAVTTLKRKMSEANFPLEGRWMMVNAAFIEGLDRWALSVGAGGGGVYLPNTSESTLRNGFSGSLLGFDLFVTSNPQSVRITANNDGWRIFAGQGNEAVTMARQINTIERYRSHQAFADVVRGLTVYGAKAVHPDRVFYLDHVKAA